MHSILRRAILSPLTRLPTRLRLSGANSSNLLLTPTSTSTSTSTWRSGFHRIAIMSTLITATTVGVMHEPTNTTTSTINSESSSSSSSSLNSSDRTSWSNFHDRPSTVWDKVRSIWIPTNEKALFEAEKKILKYITTVPYQSQLVPIAGDPILPNSSPWYINTLTLTNPDLASSSPSHPPVVLLHGFGAGVGLWLGSFNGLGQAFPKVHALDMIGWGRSSRVDFEELLNRKIKAQCLTKKPKPGQTKLEAEQAYLQAVATIAEDFTVDALEQWRIAQGHEKIILVGHSMGGYLSAAYALRHPDRVTNLVLASPIGVPEKKELNIRFGWLGRQILAFARWAWWDASVTPQSIVRALGPYGNRPVRNYVTKRFVDNEAELHEREGQKAQARAQNNPHQQQEAQPISESSPSTVGASTSPPSPSSSSSSSALKESSVAGLEMDDSLSAAAAVSHNEFFDKPIVADYLYHICSQPGSGEFAFARLFDQSGFAYKPLIHSLPKISKGEGPHQVPITFFYGSHDWMDVTAGVATSSIITRQGGRAQCIEIPNAGHQLFADNPKGFIQALIRATQFGK